jgi:glycosyltransferase involved in cell wall biosynthesis
MNSCPVSVVIPTFNRCTLLPRAIDSIHRQTVQCEEIIVVDDGSTDSTRDYLASIAIEKKKILKVIYQENRGPAAARNRGISEAKCDLIAFLDSDDHWHKRKLEFQYGLFRENNEFLISHTKEKWLRRGVHLNQKRKHIPQYGDIFQHCLLLCAVGMSTVMVKKELFMSVGNFDESMQCCEDYDFWLRVSCRFPFLLVDKPLTTKEGGREDQVSCIYRMGMDRFRIDSLKKLLDSDALSDKQYAFAYEEFVKKIHVFGNGCLKHGNTTIGNTYLDLISEYRPPVLGSTLR